MKKYYIINDNNEFWCEDGFGYWSKFKFSLKNRLEANIFYILLFFMLMSICGLPIDIRSVE